MVLAGVTGEPPTFEITYARPFVGELLRRYRRSGRLASVWAALRIVALVVLGALLGLTGYFPPG